MNTAPCLSLRIFCCLIGLLFSPAVGVMAAEGDVLEQAAAARQAYDAGRWEDARTAYARLAEQMPEDVEVRFRLGNIYARLGRLDEAAAAYQDLLSRQPGFQKGWHNFALVRLHQAMAALAEAGRLGAPQESVPSRQLLDALDAALSGNRPASQQECKPATAQECRPAVPPAGAPAPALAVYTAARVNLRHGCGTDHRAFVVMAADARVEIMTRENGCAQVKTATGEVGWLPLSLLRLAPAANDKRDR